MSTYQGPLLPIKSWAEEDRPREKMLLKGKHSLTNAELVAILIGSGTKEMSAVALAQKILHEVEGDLHRLGRKTIGELMKFKGVGEAKGVVIAAALELGRRRQQTDVKSKPKVSGSKDAFHILAPFLVDLPHEEFWILLLNRANRVLSKQFISSGGISGTVADAKIIFKKALEGNASSIILSHNHPSGNLQPSQADISLTSKLRAAGETLEINVLDHLIISEQGYYSFADEGLM